MHKRQSSTYSPLAYTALPTTPFGARASQPSIGSCSIGKNEVARGRKLCMQCLRLSRYLDARDRGAPSIMCETRSEMKDSSAFYPCMVASRRDRSHTT